MSGRVAGVVDSAAGFGDPVGFTLRTGSEPPPGQISALDLDPLVPSTRIGDGLNDAHVADALLEIRKRTNATF